jgi:hypothetical protein
MKQETILNAMEKATDDIELLTTDELVADIFVGKRTRQRNAFRARILAMNAELRFENDTIHEYYKGLQYEKDKRIAELEGIVKDLEEEVDGLLIQQIGDWDGRA